MKRGPAVRKLSTAEVFFICNARFLTPLRDSMAYGVKSSVVAVLKPNSICHVHSKYSERKIKKRYMQMLDSEWKKQNGTIQNAAFVHLLMLMDRRNRSQKRVTSMLQYQ